MEKRTVFTPQRYIPSGEADSSWQKYLIEAKDPPGFVVKKIDDTIGKGVFTKSKIRAGSFIMEYCGELIDFKTAQERERDYPKEYGSYMLFFRHRRKLWCIDATFSTAAGRYINDGTGADKNAELKVVLVKNVPHIVLFADRNIKPNEEVRFDYGVSNLPWRVKTEKGQYSQRSRDATLENKTLRKCELKNCRVLVERCDKALAVGKIYLEKEDGTFIEVSCKLNGNDSTMSLTDPKGTQRTIGNVFTHESMKEISQDHQIKQTNVNEEIYFASPYYWTEHNEEDIYVTSSRERKRILKSNGNNSNYALETHDKTTPMVSEGDNSSISLETKDETNPMVSEGNNFNRSHDGTTPLVNEEVESSLLTIEDSTSDDGNKTTGITSRDISEKTIIIEDQDQHDCEESCIAVTPRAIFEGHVIGDYIEYVEENALSSEFCKLSMSMEKKDDTLTKFPTKIIGDKLNNTLQTKDEITPIVNEGNKVNKSSGTQYETTPMISEGYNSNRSLETEDEAPMVSEGNNYNRSSIIHDETTPKVNEEVESSLLTIEDSTSDDGIKTTGTKYNNSNHVGPSEINHHPKPHRPCPYCMCNKSALTKHLKAKHSDEEEVKSAMSLPKKKQNRAFLLLKRKGIMVKNMEMLRNSSKNHRELLCERKPRGLKASKSKDVIYCSKCFGVLKKDYFHRHRRTCYLNEDSQYVPFAITPQNKSIEDSKDDDFNAEILSSLHNDDIGKICKKDSIIQDYGRKKFRKLQKRKQITNYEDRKNVIRTEMRRLGQLFNEFGNVCDTNNIHCDSSVDMLKRDNFNYLQTAIENMTTDDGGEMKPGVRKEIGYLLKRFAKYLHGFFSVEKKDDVVSELNKFLDVLNHFWQDIFGEAEYALAYKRQTMLRKPQNLPKEKDIRKLRDIMLSKLREFTENDFSFISSDDFRLLRDIVVSRLTLFNARRGGEPSRLKIHQWEEADQDNWLGEKSHNPDPIEKALLGKFKITYQAGKGGRLVPLLILNDCWKALAKLCDNEIRKQAGIHPENTYVFPLTQLSKKHVSGWVSVHECCSMAKLENMITATNMRHYIATVYAGLDMSESDRETFYSHMGHSASINKHVYQSPLARQTITKIGKFLEGVDKGMHGIATSSEATTLTDIEGKQAVNKEESHNDSAKKKGNYTVTMERSEPLETKENDSDYHPHPSSDNSDENTSSNGCIEEPISPRKKRKYVPWEKEDTRKIQNYFQKYIYSSDVVTGNCGPLPNVNELKVFLVKHPSILKELPLRDQIARLRTKIFNERKLSREKLSKYSGQGKRCTDV